MALFLRTTDKHGKSHGGFQWPLEVGAIVTAPDWDATPECGNGLHGLLNGEGDASHLSDKPDAIWWIVEADNAVDLGGKHKFQSCKVVAFGTREEVTPQLRKMSGGAVHCLTEVGGYRATLTGGNCATLTGGYCATLTGGYRATLTGGDYATLIFLRWIDGRRRVLTAHVGEDGIRPGAAYRASDDHKSVVPA